MKMPHFNLRLVTENGLINFFQFFRLSHPKGTVDLSCSLDDQ